MRSLARVVATGSSRQPSRRGQRWLRTLLPLLVVPILGSGSAQHDPASPSREGGIYFGLLHAHTAVSDGSGTPEEAYAMAEQADLDFFAVTPHNHAKAEGPGRVGSRKDGVLIGNDHDLYNADGPVTYTRRWKASKNGPWKTDGPITTKSVRSAADDATDADFVGLFGQEFSTISSGNHMNVFGVRNVITTTSGYYKGLFDYLEDLPNQDEIVAQLNHPGVYADLFYKGNDSGKKKAMRNDYGIDDDDLGPEFADLVARQDPYVHLIEMLSGPALSPSLPNNFRYRAHSNDYYFYLVMGFHISPTAGQDNHYKTWGTITDARTGVHAESLTRAGLVAAFRQNRTYASEDKNLRIFFTLNGQHGMGSAVDLPLETELNFALVLEDPDEGGATYDAVLYYGDVAPAHRDEVDNWTAADGETETKARSGDGTIPFGGYSASGKPEFFYVMVTQSDGDRAWTAPIWINHPRSYEIGAAAGEPQVLEFVWSINSKKKYYHTPDCPWGPRKPETKRTGTPPDGWQPHSCVTENEGHEGEGH